MSTHSRNEPSSPAPTTPPDPASSYERAKPEKEAGQGRLDNNIATPTDRPDHTRDAVHNKQSPERQINAHESEDERSSRPMTDAAADRPAGEVDHSMFEEEPDGWDQAPLDIKDPRHKRHSRTEGRGGTP
jgi:hypothetical protein